MACSVLMPRQLREDPERVQNRRCLPWLHIPALRKTKHSVQVLIIGLLSRSLHDSGLTPLKKSWQGGIKEGSNTGASGGDCCAARHEEGQQGYTKVLCRTNEVAVSDQCPKAEEGGPLGTWPRAPLAPRLGGADLAAESQIASLRLQAPDKARALAEHGKKAGAGASACPCEVHRDRYVLNTRISTRDLLDAERAPRRKIWADAQLRMFELKCCDDINILNHPDMRKGT